MLQRILHIWSYLQSTVQHGTSATTMPGRNRRTRASGRDDFQDRREQDQPSDNNNQTRHGPFSQGRPRTRPSTRTHSPFTGIRRSSDSSDPVLSAKLRRVKVHSNIVKVELEKLIEMIDGVQPDSAAMDWSGSAGTVVYVPVPCAADGSFQHPDMRSVSIGNWPHNPDGVRPIFQQLGPTHRSGTAGPFCAAVLSSTIRQNEITASTRDNGQNVHSGVATHIPLNNGGRQVPMGASTVEEEMVRRQRSALLQQARLEERSNSEVVHNISAEVQSSASISNSGRLRANYRPPTVTTLLTPPPSPLGQCDEGRRESWAM